MQVFRCTLLERHIKRLKFPVCIFAAIAVIIVIIRSLFRVCSTKPREGKKHRVVVKKCLFLGIDVLLWSAWYSYRRAVRAQMEIETVEALPELYTEFDAGQWAALVDSMTVHAKDRITFTLTCGMEIEA